MCLHFNTSHVSINPTTEACRVRGWENFNTSHVSINRVTGCIWREKYRISIHLMFLLIVKTPPNGGNANSDFNTSHVSINPVSTRLAQPTPYFNTSHVYINQNSEIVQRNHRVISIHLMFILIVWKLPYWGSDADNFNTSHVSINRSIRNNPESLINHFNTSHVSINRFRAFFRDEILKFQYISCFY